MSGRATLVLHAKEVEVDGQLREAIERRCDALSEEFHEVTRFEINLEEDGPGWSAHGRVSGRSTDVAIRAGATDLRPAVDSFLDKVERQLRRAHDKRIFAMRRDAQKHPPKRNS